MSFSGTRFDFQVAGEFILTRNADFEVQARIEPSGGAASPSGTVSYIVAIAFTIGNDRVSVDFLRNDPIYLNGTPVGLLPGQFLPLAAGTIYETGNDSLYVKYNTGETIAYSNESITVGIPDSRAAGTAGVLGPDDGNPADDFMLPDGTVLTPPLSFTQLYQTFAGAWRVSDADTLFDYALGESTATFTNLNFPPAPVMLSDLPAALVAQAQSALAGVSFSNTQQQQNAELDYILGGGDTGLAASDANPQLDGTVSQNVTGAPTPTLFGIDPGTATIEVGSIANLATFEVFRTGPSVDVAVLDWSVIDPQQTGTVDAADYTGGVLPSGQVTLAAGATIATFTVPTPAGLSLPFETLEVGIGSTATPAPLFANTQAEETLASSVPVHGVDAVPLLYQSSGDGTLSGAGTLYAFDFGTIGADGIPASGLDVYNDAPGYANALGGSIRATGSGFAFGNIGSFANDAPGAADGFTVRPTDSIGVHSETLVVTPTSSNASGYRGVLPGVTLVVTDTVIPATAQPGAVPGTLDITGRVGGLFSQGVTLANNAPIGSDSLGVTASDVGGNVLPVQTSNLAPGASTTLALSVLAHAAGTFADTLDLAYTTVPSHAAATALPGAAVTLDGTVYQPAAPVLQTTTLDFGTVHQGDPAPTAAVIIGNGDAPGSLADELLAAFGAVGAPFGGSGSADIAPGDSGTLTAVMNTATGGVFDAFATIDYSTDDSALGAAAIGTGQVVMSGTVIGDAVPRFVETSGPGTLIQTGQTSYALNLGTYAEGGGTIDYGIAVGNAASAPADTLSGTLTLSVDGFVVPLGAVSDIAPGSLSATSSLALDPSTPGIVKETVTLYPVDSVAGTLAPQTLAITADVLCFAAGTRLLSERGPVPIEALQAGERLVTLGGALQPIVWIGRRQVDISRHPRPAHVRPVRIAAGAVAPGVPLRDLWVSPDHAIWLDGVLVAARQLINGSTFAPDHRLREVTYLHVELPAHAVILAEWLPTESYLDTGNRALFANAALPPVLHPDLSGTDPAETARRVAGACAPFIVAAEQVRPLWERLACRAVEMGAPPRSVAVTQDPALRLRVGGRLLRPVAIHGRRHFWAPPAGSRTADLWSRAAPPALRQPWSDDRRNLGVAVSRIVLHRPEGREILPLDSPALGTGWWDIEREGDTIWRWTDGAAAMPADALLEVDVLAPGSYPLAPAEETGWTEEHAAWPTP